MKNVEFIDLKTFSFKYISLYIQLFLIIVLLGIGIAYFFVQDKSILTLVLYGVLSVLMLIMAYNNKVFYKRKYMSILYIVLSIILIFSLVVELIW